MADWAAEYFQHRNVEDLYLNDVSWYAEQNPEHFAFHIGEQVSGDSSLTRTGVRGLRSSGWASWASQCLPKMRWLQ